MFISRVSDDVVSYANERLAEMIRTPLIKLIGHHSPNFYLHADDRQSLAAMIKSEGGYQNYELELKRSDGEHFWALLTAKLFQFEGEAAIITTLIDISEQKEDQAMSIRRGSRITIRS